MTNPQLPATPPGWYPVAAGQSLQRYWDGTAWTEHTYDPTPQPMRAPEGANTNTVWIWLIAAGGPAIQLVLALFELSSLSALAGADFTDPKSMYGAIYTPAYFVLIAGSWVLYGLLVVLAWLDYRQLRSEGVPRPFHWAWSFLYSITYVIGRSVVVKRRTGKGLAPLWAFIALQAIEIIVGVVVAGVVFATVAQNIVSTYPVN